MNRLAHALWPLGLSAMIFAAIMLTASIVNAAPPTSPPGQGECDRGNSTATCRPDPQPSHGADCDEHGNNGGINEDHCASPTPEVTPSATPSPEPSEEPSPSVDPTPTPEPSVVPSPSVAPTPSQAPSVAPSSEPTTRPTSRPTVNSTMPPTDTVAATKLVDFNVSTAGLGFVFLGALFIGIAVIGSELRRIK